MAVLNVSNKEKFNKLTPALISNLIKSQKRKNSKNSKKNETKMEKIKKIYLLSRDHKFLPNVDDEH